MKRIIGIVLLILLACSVWAQHQILYKDQFTLLYDPPTEMPNLLTGESLVYRIWLWDAAQGPTPTMTTAGWIYYAETPDLEQYIVTPPDPRREYAVGVQLVHIRADLVETIGDFAVTTNPDDIDPAGVPGVPFTYAPAGLLQLGKARNLRDSGM